MHYLSHAFHALSDLMVDFGSVPSREVRARPYVYQQAVLSANIPIHASISVETTHHMAMPSQQQQQRPQAPTTGVNPGVTPSGGGVRAASLPPQRPANPSAPRQPRAPMVHLLQGTGMPHIQGNATGICLHYFHGSCNPSIHQRPLPLRPSSISFPVRASNTVLLIAP